MVKKFSKGILLSFMGIACTLIFSSCTTLGTPEKRVEEYKKVTCYGSEMLKAIQSGSYKDFVRGFSRELTETISEQAFNKLCDDLKKNKDSLRSWQFVTSLNRAGIYRVDLWKVTFVRATSNGKLPIERLFMVTSAKLDGKEQIIGFKFDMLF